MRRNPRVIVAGMGPAGIELMTNETLTLARSSSATFVRTERHPAVGDLRANDYAFETFDVVYDSASTIEDVYSTIVRTLVEAARINGEVLYLVPGSPLIAESTVVQLRAMEDIDVVIKPAMSFLDLVWQRLGIDPFASTPRMIDGYNFAQEAAGERGPLLVGQCDSVEVLSDIKLAFENETPATAIVLQRLGLENEFVEELNWEDIDRSFTPDHLTSIWIPKIPVPAAGELVRLDEVARRLRSDCPWDQEQTHKSLAKHAIEEVYEMVDAIDSLDEDDEHFIEELGDVLFQVYAHCAIAEQEGRFNITDVAKGVTDKLIARHPHVYGDKHVETSSDVVAGWEAAKMAEKNRTSPMDGIPAGLPALAYAQKVLSRAASSGNEIDVDNVSVKGPGVALLMMVDHARRNGVDAEAELRAVVNQLRSTFYPAVS